MEDNLDKLRGLFEGGNFPNAQINVLTGDGVQISYESAKQDAQKEDDSKNQKQGKDAIMEYVGRLKPVVKEQYLDHYDQIWEGILEINQVKAVIYNKGKQQDTTFNRNLLAKIIHQVSWWLYESSANTVIMAEYLEPGKGIDHPVRQKLGESPNKDLKKALEQFVSTIK